MQKVLESDRDLSEVPLGQKRRLARPLPEYEAQASSRDEAIAAAYPCGGYTMKEIGEYFGLHYSWISRLLKALEAKDKT